MAFSNRFQLLDRTTVRTPALAMFGDELFMVWQAPNYGGILVSTYTVASGWSIPFVPPGLSGVLVANDGVAIAPFRGSLYMCWVGDGLKVYYSFLDPDTGAWAAPAPIPGAVAAATPALAFYDDRLWLAYLDGPQHTATAYLDHTLVWSTPETQIWVRSGYGPGLAAYGDELYIAISDPNNLVHYKSYSPASGWGDLTEIPSSQSAGAPQLVAFGASLYLVTRTNSQSLAYARYTEAGGWAAATTVENTTAIAPPGVAGYRDACGSSLCIAWPSTSGAVHFASNGTIGSAPTFACMPSSAAALHAPALAQHGDRVYMVYCDLSTNVLDVWVGTVGLLCQDTYATTWASTSRPALADFGGTLYLAWSQSDQGEVLAVATLTAGRTWSAPTSLPAAVSQAGAGVALAELDGTLYLAFCTQADVQYMTLAPGGVWSAPVKVPGSGTPGAGVAMAALGDDLHVVWPSREGGQIRWTKMHKGGAWGPVVDAPGSWSTQSAGLAAYGNELYLSAMHPDGTIGYACYDDDSGWTVLADAGQSPVHAPGTDVALAPIGGGGHRTLMMAYVDGGQISLGSLLGSVTVDARFTRGYALASAVQAGSQVLAIADGVDGGMVQALTVGSDGQVYFVHLDPTSDTGWSTTAIGLQATQIAALTGSDGRIVVFAPQGSGVVSVTQSARGSASWGAPQLLGTVSGTVAAVVAGAVDGVAYLATFAGSAPSYSVYLAQSAGAIRDVGTLQDFTASTTSAAIGLAQPFIGPGAALYVFENPLRVQPFDASASPVTIALAGAPVAGSVGNHDDEYAVVVVALSGSSSLYQIGASGATAIGSLPTGVTVTSASVSARGANVSEVFLTGSDQRLYHAHQLGTLATDPWEMPLALYNGCVSVSSAVGARGSQGFCATTGHFLKMVSQVASTSDWSDVTIESSLPGATIQEIVVQALEITFSNPDGSPVANETVNVITPSGAIQPLQLAGNGALTSAAGARIRTDRRGVVSISVPVRSLATSNIQVSLIESSDYSSFVAPNVELDYRFRTLSKDDVLAARDRQGQPLLQGDHRERDAQVIADTTVAAMLLGGPSRHFDVDAYLARDRRAPGLRFRTRLSAAVPAKPGSASSPEAHWIADLREGRTAFRRLARDEAAALLAARRRTLSPVSDLPQLKAAWGDIWQTIDAGAARLEEVLVTTVEEKVHAAITLVVDEVEYGFEATVDRMEQCFDVVQGLWKRFDVGFDKLFEWLGLVFDWPNILRTQEVVSYSLGQVLSFLGQATEGIKGVMVGGIETLAARVRTDLQWAIDNVLQDKSMNDLAAAHPAPDAAVQAQLSHNLVYTAFVSNADGATWGGSAAIARPAWLATLIDALRSFGGSLGSKAAFAQAAQYLAEVGRDPNEFMQLVLAALLSAVEAAALAGLEAATSTVEAIFAALAQLTAAIQEAFSASYSVPFVSELYAYVTKSEENPDGEALTPGGTVALILSVAATPLYVAVYGAAPFPDAASVTAYKQLFTAGRLLANSGFGATTTPAPPPDPVVREVAEKLLSVLYTVNYFFYGGLEPILDSVVSPAKPAPALSLADLALEWGAQVWGLPLGLLDDVTLLWNCAPANFENVLWLYQNIGAALDSGWYLSESVLGRNASDVGVYVDFLYACLHTVFIAGLVAAEANAYPAKTAQNFLGVTPELLKLLRLSFIVEASDENSLAVLAAVDVIGNEAVALLNLFRATGALAAARRPYGVGTSGVPAGSLSVPSSRMRIGGA